MTYDMSDADFMRVCLIKTKLAEDHAKCYHCSFRFVCHTQKDTRDPEMVEIKDMAGNIDFVAC